MPSKKKPDSRKAAKEGQHDKRPVLLHFSPETLQRIDEAAKRTLTSRAGFIRLSIAEKLESMQALTSQGGRQL